MMVRREEASFAALDERRILLCRWEEDGYSPAELWHFAEQLDMIITINLDEEENDSALGEST